MRKLTDTEISLFYHVMKDVKALKSNVAPDSFVLSDGPKPPLTVRPEPTFTVRDEGLGDASYYTYNHHPSPNKRALDVNSGRDVDRKTFERFRRGKMHIDLVVDLHGMHSHEAELIFRRTIVGSRKRGYRCLLVITGKGKRSFHENGETYMANGRKGALRESLPQWVNSPQLSSHVLAFHTAQQKHGGAGAYYILLRKNDGHLS